MSCFISSSWVSPCSSISTPDSISFSFSLNPFQYPTHQSPNPDRKFSKSSLPSVVIQSGLRELRNRINTVKNTQKITEAMKLVAAAKVRRAQEAVINSRPFTETVVGFLYSINRCAQLEVIKKANARAKELKERGIECTVISVGKKGNAHFRHRDDIAVDRFVEGGVFPTAKEAQAIADDVFSLFVSEEVDKVELVYTKFVSLVKSDPVIQTLLPLSMKGEARDEKGECVDSIEDEMFRLTSKDGKLAMERTKTQAGEPEISPLLQFEQDPVQILDAMMPLYLNSQILRALQESFASELASRMSAMSNATDNAVELKKNLTMAYNRERQAKITGELLEIVAGAEALQAEA
ncbi:PREDICTED: ATP synthase gamma chain 2, chloroplastic isoform X2 [Tarenaya hassleriana]|uniref:ATP synthase gamma chain 2, chloroplastic isoform X2 n=1 Tax=Tarenaya hassleriana TaxID=28532 RepID=UPI00053C194C|nr:PREDICTED: ATP synthase gamma chain 2, chloroplastic isoform X2 [Tarenaya hassleriana]